MEEIMKTIAEVATECKLTEERVFKLCQMGEYDHIGVKKAEIRIYYPYRKMKPQTTEIAGSNPPDDDIKAINTEITRINAEIVRTNAKIKYDEVMGIRDLPEVLAQREADLNVKIQDYEQKKMVFDTEQAQQKEIWQGNWDALEVKYKDLEAREQALAQREADDKHRNQLLVQATERKLADMQVKMDEVLSKAPKPEKIVSTTIAPKPALSYSYKPTEPYKPIIQKNNSGAMPDIDDYNLVGILLVIVILAIAGYFAWQFISGFIGG
jgi:hypothetical protein